jgi:hypothetical protein
MSEQPGGQGEMPLPTIPEVILSGAALLVSLGARAIAERDTESASLAIDALAAQMPVIERIVPADALGHYRQALAELQRGYADALTPPPQPAAGDDEPPEPERPKIWTPGGDV